MKRIYIVCDNCDEHFFLDENEAIKTYEYLVDKYKDKDGELDDWVWMDNAPIETYDDFTKIYKYE